MTPEMEREAILFALELLMPSFLVRQAINDQPPDIDDEHAIKQIARMFGVSPQVMAFRIGQLI